MSTPEGPYGNPPNESGGSKGQPPAQGPGQQYQQPTQPQYPQQGQGPYPQQGQQYQQPPPGQSPPPGQYPPQGSHVQGGGGPNFGERAAEVARHIRTPETKEVFKTSEFAVWFLTIIAVLIAGGATGGDAGDPLDAGTVWLLVVVTSFAYIISRGIAKAGAKRGSDDGERDRY